MNHLWRDDSTKFTIVKAKGNTTELRDVPVRCELITNSRTSTTTAIEFHHCNDYFYDFLPAICLLSTTD